MYSVTFRHCLAAAQVNWPLPHVALRVLPAQVTVGEGQRDPALALWRQVPAARVQVLQSSRPTLSVSGLRGEALHAPQLHPAALWVRTGTGTCGESEEQQKHRDHTSRHLHLSAGQCPQPITEPHFSPGQRSPRGHVSRFLSVVLFESGSL